MNVLVFLIPVSVLIGALWLFGFVWAARRGQFDDPDGSSARILSPDYDEAPKPEE
ncbi:MAG: cbb3-type cytochrome oxidase maturation protein [Paracoccaceae bacterium]|jgi:cbb3-type cytochrome oxidase maturation protein